MSQGQHAFLPPSSASVWVRCFGQPALAAMFPQEDTEDTRHGEASHWYGSEHLYGRKHSINETAPNGVVLTEEMIDGAMEYVDDVHDQMRQHHGDYANLRVESRVHCTDIHPTHNWGTPDGYVWIPHLRRLIVWDYKFGHKQVDPFENWQCMNYVSGIVTALGFNGVDDQTVTVDIRIVQPRCYTADGTVRNWLVKLSDLRGYFNLLRHAATMATQPNPPIQSGDHCYYCPARHSCAAARKSAMAGMDYSGQSLPEPLTPEVISFEMAMLERAIEACKGRLTGLQERAESMIKSGTVVPGFGLESKVGRLAWTKTPAEIRALAACYPNVQLSKPDVFITPKQAIDAGIDEFVINAYAARPKAGLKLVKQDSNYITKVLRNGK